MHLLRLFFFNSTTFPKTIASTWPNKEFMYRLQTHLRGVFFFVFLFSFRNVRIKQCMWKSSLYKQCFYYHIHLEIEPSSFSFAVHFLRQPWQAHKEFRVESEKTEEKIKEKLKEPVTKTNSNIRKLRSAHCIRFVCMYLCVFISSYFFQCTNIE